MIRGILDVCVVRLGLRDRVHKQTRDRLFFGCIGVALCHAGYMMSRDSTMSAGT